MQYVEDKHGDEVKRRIFFFALQIASRTKLRAFVFVPGSAGDGSNEYRSRIAKFVECTDIVRNISAQSIEVLLFMSPLWR